MEDFLFTINVVIPMFLIMGAGYVLRRFGVISEELILLGNKLCYQVFLPITIFNSLVSSDFSQSFDVLAICYCLGAVVVIFFLSWGLVPLLIKDRRQIPVIDQSLVRSNLVVFGFPICSAAFGAAGTAAVGAVTAFLSPLANTLTVVFYSIYSGEKKSGVKDIVKSIFTSPLIVCSIIGAFFVVTGIKIPQVCTSALTDLGAVTTPLALLLLGADFAFGELRQNLKPLTVALTGRHLIVPLLTLIPAALLGISGPWFVALIAVFASPVASSSFAMSRVYGADHKFTGQYVVLSSALSVLSIFASVFFARVAGII